MGNQWLQFSLLYALALFLGLAFATLPAISTILTSPTEYNFSTLIYSFLLAFLTLFALVALFFGRNFNVKNLLTLGLFFNALAMLFLAFSYIGANKFTLVLCILIGIAAFLGLGLGTMLTALIRLSTDIIPSKPLSILFLFGFIAMGMGLSPLLVNYFSPSGLWWLVPTTIFVGLLLLFNFTIFIPMLQFPLPMRSSESFHYPWTFWLFFVIVLLYGFCEAMLGNWLPLYMQKVKNLTPQDGGVALATFWLMASIGRFFIGFATRMFSFRCFYIFLPLALFWILGIIPVLGLPKDLFVACGIAGLACSGFFPLSLHFGDETHAEESYIGLIIAYILGYGLGSLGSGILQALDKIPLDAIYPFAALPAALMTILAWCLLYFFPHKP